VTDHPKKHIASIASLFVFVVLAAGSVDTDRDTRAIKSQTASYTVLANKLYSEYERNEVAADEKYNGKIIIVSGAIHDIGKDVMNNAYIVIGGKGFLDGVQCTFTKGEQSSIARLSKGQQVTVKGEVGGKIGNVLVNKASLQ